MKSDGIKDPGPQRRLDWLLESMDGGDGEGYHFDDGFQLGLHVAFNFPKTAMLLAAINRSLGRKEWLNDRDLANWIAGGKTPPYLPKSAKELEGIE